MIGVKRRSTFFAVLTISALTVLMLLIATHLLFKLSLMVHQSVDDITLSKDFPVKRALCASACPGAMNCTEWDECIFHHPEACDRLELRCWDGDFTLYTEEVLAPVTRGNNYWKLSKAIVTDVFMFLLIFGMLLISMVCFRWSLVNVVLLTTSKSVNQQKMNNHFRQLCRQSSRKIYFTATGENNRKLRLFSV